jgi:NAD(P)-dependent dehydrogenase (short-subunit alcohol dehydrogenase family)
VQRLSGQVAIVTGGGQGIGGATARRLAEEGAKVLIVDYDEAAIEKNLATIRGAGGTVEALYADLGNPATLRSMIDEALLHYGKLTILVNNAYAAAPGSRGSALEITEEGFDAGMLGLTRPVFLGIRHAVPEMQKAGGGAIVNVASVHGILVAPRKLVYEAGKAAVIAMTRQMATDFGPLGIRVNAIMPGHIVTEHMYERQWEKNPEGVRFFEQHYPVRRVGRPVDIANAVVFLCSDEASFITGHALPVDGGMTVQLQEDLTVHAAHWARANPDIRMAY